MKLKDIFFASAASAALLAATGCHESKTDREEAIKQIFYTDAVNYFKNHHLLEDTVIKKSRSKTITVVSNVYAQEELLERNDSTIGTYFRLFPAKDTTGDAHLYFYQECTRHGAPHGVATEIGTFKDDQKTLDSLVQKLPKRLAKCPEFKR